MQRRPFLTVLAVLAALVVAGVGLAFLLDAPSLFAVAGLAAFALVLHVAYGPDAAPRVAGARARAQSPAPVPRSPKRALAASSTVAEANGYRPQCAALTTAGLQCRSSARGGSRYCSSHFGHQPRTAEGVVRATDTTSKVARRDTVTSFAGDATAVTTKGAQCQALTAGDLQCKNTVRSGSQFCVRHVGYRSPTPTAFVARQDTSPRVRGAPDTAPAVRRRAAA